MTGKKKIGTPFGASHSVSWLKVLRKLAAESLLPALLAFAYAVWELSSLQPAQRTAVGFVRSFGTAFFLIMWFVGQWFRASKQMSDSQQLASIRDGVDKLQKMIEVGASDSPEISRPATNDPTVALVPPNEEPISRVLDEVPKSPKGALLILGAELERELRQLLWSSGWIQGVGKATITRSVEHLVELGVLPKHLGGSVKAFLDVRNRMLHGYGVTEDEILRAVDLGLTILRAVLAIPNAQNRVYHPGVEVYEDPECRRARAGVRGIIIETTSPGSSFATYHVYPTRLATFKKGQRVSWEWNMSMVVGESWYRDVETDAVKLAWSQSAEFVGRNLDGV